MEPPIDAHSPLRLPICRSIEGEIKAGSRNPASRRQWPSFGCAALVLNPRLVCDPVRFPGFAAVVRERLLEMR